MAFGQVSGPPATGKQVAELLSLLQAAGYEGFRDARGPLGFTQRQGGGKFTRTEADELIEQLRAEADDQAAVAPPAEVAAKPAVAPRPPSAKASAADAALRRMPSELLAAELQRRGWVVMEP